MPSLVMSCGPCGKDLIQIFMPNFRGWQGSVNIGINTPLVIFLQTSGVS